MLEAVCRRATCSDLLEKMATDEQRSQGLDIADFLLMEDTPQMILARMIERNPVLQTFIDTFGLELVDAGRVELRKGIGQLAVPRESGCKIP